MTTKSPAVRQAELALEEARANAQRDAQAGQLRAFQERALTDAARSEVRRYRAEVDKAVKAVHAIKMSTVSLPPAATHVRQYARALLHRLEFRQGGYGQQDALLEALWLLHDRGLWLNDHLPNLDAPGRLELDLAESEAWRHLIIRARQVAGE